MANPSRYQPSYDFSDFESTQPTTPKPGVQLDVQFNDIAASTTSLRDAIIDIRRSDGALANGIVTYDSLASDLLSRLLAESDADAAAASAAAAAASAAEAAATADENQSLQTSLEAAIEAIETGGVYGDYGSITGVASSSDDYGAIA